jgi:hypothetical protein
MKDREIERMTGHSHVTVGKARYKLVNPDMIDARTLKEFDEFKKKFAQKWPEYLRVQFVRYFENDILTKALKGEGKPFSVALASMAEGRQATDSRLGIE